VTQSGHPFPGDPSSIAEVGQDRFQEEVLRVQRPVLVAFMANWSQPCQLLEPVLKELATVACSGLKLLKVDVDDDFDLSVWYEIERIPTVLCFRNGQVQVRIVGLATREAILAELQPFLVGS